MEQSWEDWFDGDFTPWWQKRSHEWAGEPTKAPTNMAHAFALALHPCYKSDTFIPNQRDRHLNSPFADLVENCLDHLD